jgi:hypothetical protein
MQGGDGRGGMKATLEELGRTVRSGEAILFTGAGFSGDARDLDGNALPDAQRMIEELWPLCGFDGEPDGSSLADLYDAAMLRAPDQLTTYIDRRLRIGDAPLPAHLETWLSAPWKRIYTLNVDDLEVAVERQFSLRNKLDVVHLNGFVADGAQALTFSTLQYASRLVGPDQVYRQLVEDLVSAPFVVAGTSLDEIVLWQHVELHRQSRGREVADRPGSYLVSTHLPRARRVLLEAHAIRWVEATDEQVTAYL